MRGIVGFDPSAPKKFHGGDLAGLRQHLPYLKDLGVTAVWITPPNKQAGPGATDDLRSTASAKRERTLGGGNPAG